MKYISTDAKRWVREEGATRSGIRIFLFGDLFGAEEYRMLASWDFGILGKTQHPKIKHPEFSAHRHPKLHTRYLNYTTSINF